jgi:hypothetical protein
MDYKIDCKFFNGEAIKTTQTPGNKRNSGERKPQNKIFMILSICFFFEFFKSFLFSLLTRLL